MAAKGTSAGGFGKNEVSRVTIAVAALLILLLLGVGGFYVYNGGWKTEAQLRDEGAHNFVPLKAAEHGDMGPLEAENRLRKERGEPLLELPKDRHQRAADSAGKMAELRKQLEARQGGGAAQPTNP